MSKKTNHFRRAINRLFQKEISSVKGIPTPVMGVFCTNRKPVPVSSFGEDPSVGEDCFRSGGGCLCDELVRCNESDFLKLNQEDIDFGDPRSMAEVRDEAFGSRAGITPEVFCPKTGSRSGKPVLVTH